DDRGRRARDQGRPCGDENGRLSGDSPRRGRVEPSGNAAPSRPYGLIVPKSRPVVASFWVLRPEEHPEAEERNYPGMLRILQRSCDRLGLRHVVLTDHATMTSPAWPTGVDP